jgi:hypothetical protein
VDWQARFGTSIELSIPFNQPGKINNMLTKKEALELVSKKLRTMSPPDDTFVCRDAGTIEKSFSWVFFYNSKTYLETGEIRYALAGNGPVIVNKHDGTIEFCGMSKSVESSIEEYERKLAAQRKL